MEPDLNLIITPLSDIDRKLISVVLDTMINNDRDKYEKLSQIFSKRAEIIKTLEEIIK